jgi:hypothetical protein
MKSLNTLLEFISNIFVYIVLLFILYTIYIALKNYYDKSYEVVLHFDNEPAEY